MKIDLLLIFKVPIGCESHLWAYASDRVPGCGVEDPADLQAHIVATLLAFRLTLSLFLSSLLLPCLFADFGSHSRFHARSDFISLVFRKMLYTLSDAISRRLDSSLKEHTLFSSPRFLASVLLSAFSRISAMAVFHRFLPGSISRILHRHPIPWNALHGIFS